MSNERVVPTSTEDLRAVAHDVANALCVSDIGGECYHGSQHACFARQGRKPLQLYKVEEMCERCAASWHAVMAASLLDSVVISQQFLGEAPRSALEQQFLHAERASNGASVQGKAIPARKRQPSAAPKASGAKKRAAKTKDASQPKAEDLDAGITPSSGGKYSVEDRARLVSHYQSLSRDAKTAFNRRYKVKAWQMRDWAK
jgi:hypothetical protein